MEILLGSTSSIARSCSETVADAEKKDSGGQLAEEINADSRRRQIESSRSTVGQFGVEKLRDRAGLRALRGGDAKGIFE